MIGFDCPQAVVGLGLFGAPISLKNPVGTCSRVHQSVVDLGACRASRPRNAARHCRSCKRSHRKFSGLSITTKRRSSTRSRAHQVVAERRRSRAPPGRMGGPPTPCNGRWDQSRAWARARVRRWCRRFAMASTHSPPDMRSTAHRMWLGVAHGLGWAGLRAGIDNRGSERLRRRPRARALVRRCRGSLACQLARASCTTLPRWPTKAKHPSKSGQVRVTTVCGRPMVACSMFPRVGGCYPRAMLASRGASKRRDRVGRSKKSVAVRCSRVVYGHPEPPLLRLKRT